MGHPTLCDSCPRKKGKVKFSCAKSEERKQTKTQSCCTWLQDQQKTTFSFTGLSLGAKVIISRESGLTDIMGPHRKMAPVLNVVVVLLIQLVATSSGHKLLRGEGSGGGGVDIRLPFLNIKAGGGGGGDKGGAPIYHYPSGTGYGTGDGGGAKYGGGSGGGGISIGDFLHIGGFGGGGGDGQKGYGKGSKSGGGEGFGGFSLQIGGRGFGFGRKYGGGQGGGYGGGQGSGYGGGHGGGYGGGEGGGFIGGEGGGGGYISGGGGGGGSGLFGGKGGGSIGLEGDGHVGGKKEPKEAQFDIEPRMKTPIAKRQDPGATDTGASTGSNGDAGLSVGGGSSVSLGLFGGGVGGLEGLLGDGSPSAVLKGLVDDPNQPKKFVDPRPTEGPNVFFYNEQPVYKPSGEVQTPLYGRFKIVKEKFKD